MLKKMTYENLLEIDAATNGGSSNAFVTKY
jgi:hypothetical protein